VVERETGIVLCDVLCEGSQYAVSESTGLSGAVHTRGDAGRWWEAGESRLLSLFVSLLSSFIQIPRIWWSSTVLCWQFCWVHVLIM